tara:strand:- start:288 stop:746 length:459 start_codon:yes stop_codon:yes gene_type:complete
MKVILLENIRKLGSIGDIIEVKRGFARNYLISNKKALFASKKNIDEVDKIKKELNKKDLDKKKESKDKSDKVNNKTYKIKKLSTENKELYGSVKPSEISKLVEEEDNIKIDSSIIQPVKEIKSLGRFKIVINFHSEIQATIYIEVLPQEEKK